MNIVQLKGLTERRVLSSCGALRPFTEVSLLEQVLCALTSLTPGQSEYLVFSKEEGEQIDMLRKQVGDDVHFDKTKRGKKGLAPFLAQLLQHHLSVSVDYIASDEEINKPTVQMENWLLVVSRP